MRDIILKGNSKTRSTIFYHIIAWGLFIAYEISFSAALRGSYNHYLDYFLHYPLYILLFYIHCYLLLGRIRLKKISDYIKLILYLIIEMLSYYCLNIIINNYLVLSELPVNVIETHSRLFHFATVYRFIYITALSTAFRIALNLLKSQKQNLEFVTETLTHEREKESLRTELVSAELSLLRSQVNPHFLFNTLNSVYNRVRKNDPNSAEYVMALADLMRYALQPEAATDEVAVESELEHISNYLKIQTMRYSTEIDVNIAVKVADLKIAPLLLITIVENIFQHGELNNPKCRPLIEIIVSDGELVMRTKNSIRPDHRPGNGVGLTNIRKRLEYQYKDRFEFDYTANRKIFKLKLLIKLR